MPDIVPELAHQIDPIYQAAVAPEQWPVFLKGLREELRLGSIHRVFRHPTDGDRGIVASAGIDEHYEDADRSYYYRLNPWRPFGLEAEVASRVASGMGLSEIGEDLGIAIHSVRGYLKQLFAKTNTHRQAELVRVILAGPARILPDRRAEDLP